VDGLLQQVRSSLLITIGGRKHSEQKVQLAGSEGCCLFNAGQTVLRRYGSEILEV
jgi:hypothetical protein